MAAHPGTAARRRSCCTPDLWVAEVVYRPLETELLRDARASAAAARSTAAAWPSSRPRDVVRAVHRRRARPRAHARATSPTLAARRRARDGARLTCGAGIATVCLSGTLEEKLAAAAARRLRRRRAVRGRPASPRRSRPERGPPTAPPSSAWRSTSTSRSATSRRSPGDALARNLRRAEAQVRRDGALGADHDARLLERLAGRRSTTTTLAAEQLRALAERAARARPADRLRGARLGPPRRASTTTRGGSSQRRRPPARSASAWTASTSSRAARPRRRSRDDPGREDLLPPARRRAAAASWTSCSGAGTTAASRARAASTSPASCARVLATGYAGPLSLEVFNDVFRQADPERMAVDAMRSLLRPRGGARRVAPLPRAPRRSAATRSSSSRSTPDVGRPRPSALLHALGFAPRRPAPHQAGARCGSSGDARVAAQRTAPAATPRRRRDRGRERRTRPRPRDARRGAARPGPPARPRPGRGRPRAVAAPDGTAVFFCRTDAGRRRLAATTSRRSAAGGGAEAAAIDRIDHVALVQPFDSFDEAALFYRSVLGLRAAREPRARRARRARPQPRGDQRRRQRAARAQRPAARPASDEPPRSSTSRFACDDVLAAARRMRERGVAAAARSPTTTTTTSPPALELDAEPWRRMRELGVLYDRDARRRAPALLHRRSVGPRCSSRSSSGAAATTATARPTRRCAWPRSGRRSPRAESHASQEESREPPHRRPLRTYRPDDGREDPAQGGARQLDRQRARVLRLLHLRHRRRARLRQGLLPGVRPRDGHAAVVRDLRRRLRRAPDRRVLHGPHRRPVRPQARAAAHRAR